MTSYERTNENAASVLIKSEGVLQSKPAPVWRNWQTRRTQNPAPRNAYALAVNAMQRQKIFGPDLLALSQMAD